MILIGFEREKCGSRRAKKEEGTSKRCRGYASLFIHKRYPTTNQRGSFCLLCFQPVPLHSSLSNLSSNDYSTLGILTSALVRTLDRHARISAVLPVHAHPIPFSSARSNAYRDTPRPPAESAAAPNHSNPFVLSNWLYCRCVGSSVQSNSWIS